MRFEFEIIYDWHDDFGFFPDEENCHEMFVGTSEELDRRVRDLRECGCKNIFFNRLGEAEEVEDDPNGKRKNFRWSEKKQRWQESPAGSYPEVAVFGQWDFFPYLD